MEKEAIKTKSYVLLDLKEAEDIILSLRKTKTFYTMTLGIESKINKRLSLLIKRFLNLKKKIKENKNITKLKKKSSKKGNIIVRTTDGRILLRR